MLCQQYWQHVENIFDLNLNLIVFFSDVPSVVIHILFSEDLVTARLPIPMKQD